MRGSRKSSANIRHEGNFDCTRHAFRMKMPGRPCQQARAGCEPAAAGWIMIGAGRVFCFLPCPVPGYMFAAAKMWT